MITSHHIHGDIARDLQARRIAEARVARSARRRTAAETPAVSTAHRSPIRGVLSRAARATRAAA